MRDHKSRYSQRIYRDTFYREIPFVELQLLSQKLVANGSSNASVLKRQKLKCFFFLKQLSEIRNDIQFFLFA